MRCSGCFVDFCLQPQGRQAESAIQLATSQIAEQRDPKERLADPCLSVAHAARSLATMPFSTAASSSFRTGMLNSTLVTSPP